MSVEQSAHLFFCLQQLVQPEMNDGLRVQVIQAGEGRTLSRWVPDSDIMSPDDTFITFMLP